MDFRTYFDRNIDAAIAVIAEQVVDGLCTDIESYRLQCGRILGLKEAKQIFGELAEKSAEQLQQMEESL